MFGAQAQIKNSKQWEHRDEYDDVFATKDAWDPMRDGPVPDTPPIWDMVKGEDKHPHNMVATLRFLQYPILHGIKQPITQSKEQPRGRHGCIGENE